MCHGKWRCFRRALPDFAALAKADLSQVLALWAGLGYSTLVVLGGLQSLDQEVFEAARIDGATEAKIFWQITFPLMRPILIAT